ncbi:TPA: hypothetical protein N2859_004680 [Vibrio parahaemolyticus]|uniref:hypothetical protein n=1 Tax=Vibrio parahaemolyticus TaxID=670 RepID=UPI000946B26D|nr:hypothetical protein [Vibrio parahaemolyticus]OLF42153.1 hypothetical protein BUQ66_24825 [Vibrio parahaemolyticus]HCM1082217.1 hypothetical protein [Vibrio parahaemolyticus]
MKQVILLGTNHTLQRGNTQFATYIRDLVSQYQIKCIAEEIDAPEPSSASELAKDHNINHIVIEPTPDERASLGIPNLNIVSRTLMDKYDLSFWPSDATAEELPDGMYDEFEAITQQTHRLREQEWWKRITNNDIWPCLVICGASHFDAFKKLLLNKNVTVIDAHSCWELCT